MLYHRELGCGRPVIILHGLFGSSDNWLSLAKLLSSDYKIYLVDQRNHGRSFHDDSFNYYVMAEDLRQFINSHCIKKPILIGHSMGGKVVMQFAEQYPDCPAKLVVIDIAPRSYATHEHQTILNTLNKLNLKKIKTRKQAEQELAKLIRENGVLQFLLKNLYRQYQVFHWRVNLISLTKNITNVGAALQLQKAHKCPTLFIKGGKSGYINAQDMQKIKKYFPLSRVETVQNAGHWVHAEKPVEIINIIKNFI